MSGSSEASELYDAGLASLLGKDVSQDIEQALSTLHQAVEAGSGRAAARLSVLTALGVTGSPDWNGALDLLEQAACLGDTDARQQLGVLTANEALARRIKTSTTHGEAVWRRARAAVDLHAWLSPAASNVVSGAPRIEVMRKFASAAVCRWLARRGGEAQAPAIMNDARTGRQRLDPARTNSAQHFGLAETDLVFMLTQGRIGTATGQSIQNMEPPNVLRYQPGQSFTAHFDWFDPQDAHFRRVVDLMGQRVCTVLIYLNDAYSGGETDFPDAGFRFRGRRGDALIFWNVQPDGTPDPLTRHAGLPPSSGEKWVLSQWIRNRVQAIT